MGYKIEKQVTNYGTRNSINNLIIAHETANSNSTIEGEVAYMKRNASSAFVTHFVGGGGRIIQTAPVGKVSWGAGPKANGYAYAQVELCRAKDKATFQKDYAAYIWLLRELASNAGIPKTLDTGSSVYDKGIKSHKWVSDKLGGTDHQDPYGYLASRGISKEQFAKDISGGLGSASPAPTSSKPVTPKPAAKSIETLVAETKAGVHKNGDARKKSLGSNYNAVMDIINGKKTTKAVAKKFNLPDTEYWVKKPQFSGSGVLVVQNALSSIYFYPDKGAKNNGCDSYYGPKSADAVKRFQSVHGLKADGIYGDSTRKKLDSLVNK